MLPNSVALYMLIKVLYLLNINLIYYLADIINYPNSLNREYIRLLIL